MMRGSEDDGPRVGLISSAVDGGVAQVVQAGLAEMAIRATEIRGDDGGPFDAVIVLVSLAAVHDQRWQERVAAITADRVVPVQLDAKAEFSMPSSLADRQWVPFSPSEPAVAVGAILVGLRNDEDLHKRRRRLEAEAAVWQQQGRESTLLIAGHLRASEAVALGDDLQAVGQAFSDTARAFVDTSQPYARRRRRNRRLIALTLVVTVALAIAGGLVLLPGVFQARTTQEAGFITTPDPSFVEQVPSWSALLAGELMIHPASEAQLLIARSSDLADRKGDPAIDVEPAVVAGSGGIHRPRSAGSDPVEWCHDGRGSAASPVRNHGCRIVRSLVGRMDVVGCGRRGILGHRPRTT